MNGNFNFNYLLRQELKLSIYGVTLSQAWASFDTLIDLLLASILFFGHKPTNRILNSSAQKWIKLASNHFEFCFSSKAYIHTVYSIKYSQHLLYLNFEEMSRKTRLVFKWNAVQMSESPFSVPSCSGNANNNVCLGLVSSMAWSLHLCKIFSFCFGSSCCQKNVRQTATATATATVTCPAATKWKTQSNNNWNRYVTAGIPLRNLKRIYYTIMFAWKYFPQEDSFVECSKSVELHDKCMIPSRTVSVRVVCAIGILTVAFGNIHAHAVRVSEAKQDIPLAN